MRPRIHFANTIRVWVTSVGLACLVLGSLAFLAIAALSPPKESAFEWACIVVVCAGSLDVVVTTLYKVVTGGERRRAIRRGEDAWFDGDLATVVRELQPFERDLDLTVRTHYLSAKRSLGLSGSSEAEGE